MTWKNLCVKHDYGRRLSEVYNTAQSASRSAAHRFVNPDTEMVSSNSFPGASPFATQPSSSRYFEGSSTPGRPKLRSYKSHFKQRYLVEAAWRSGGTSTTRNITQEGGVVTSLHLTPKYIIVALDNAKIHVFDTEGDSQRTLQGHVMGVWAMVPWDDTLVSGGCDRDVRVWNLKTGYVGPSEGGGTCANLPQGLPAYPAWPYVNRQVSQDGRCQHGYLWFAGYDASNLGYPNGALQKRAAWAPFQCPVLGDQGRHRCFR